MKHLFEKLTLCALLLSGLSLSAGECYDYCDPCCDYNPCCWDGNFYLTVEGLYWTVNHCPIGVARRSNQNSVDPEGLTAETYLYNEYDGGVRGRIGYEFCSFFTDVAYLYYSNKEKEDEELDGFNAMRVAGGPPSDEDQSFISSKAKFRYQNVDVRLGYNLCQTNCFTPFVYVNARWVRVDFKNIVDAIDTDTTNPELFHARQASRFNGGALGVGLGGHYTFCGNFGIGSTANFMALIGQTTFNYSKINESRSYNPFFEKTYSWDHVTPSVEFRLGLDYSCCLFCFDVTVEIGYELDWYPNLLYYFSENEPAPGASFRIPNLTCQDIGFSGPFFRLTAGF